MLKRIEIENAKAREKEAAKRRAEKARAVELKEDLVKQLAKKAEIKKFEAEEERQLNIQAKIKADKEEEKRKIALAELMERMQSKQKIGESILFDTEAAAKADEARAMRHQAIYDEKKRKEEAGVEHVADEEEEELDLWHKEEAQVALGEGKRAELATCCRRLGPVAQLADLICCIFDQDG